MRYVDAHACRSRIYNAIFDTHAFIRGYKMTSTDILGLNMLAGTEDRQL
jgi:hypothetical protein